MRLILIIFPMSIATHLFAYGLEWCSYCNTNEYSFKVEYSVIDKTPIWSTNDGQPPLSARLALAQAKICLFKLFKDAKDWDLDEVGLQPVEGHDGHWVYLVTFNSPSPTPFGGHFDSIRIPVLMSGVALEPEVFSRP